MNLVELTLEISVTSNFSYSLTPSRLEAHTGSEVLWLYLELEDTRLLQAMLNPGLGLAKGRVDLRGQKANMSKAKIKLPGDARTSHV
jgi:hypothetical protein